MRRSTKTGIIVAALVGAVIYFVVAVIHDEHQRRLQTPTLKNLKELALAMKLYSADHHGSLPTSLSELFPAYTSEGFASDHPAYLTPGASLEKLSGDTVILRAPDGTGRVAEVRADMSGSIKQP